MNTIDRITDKVRRAKLSVDPRIDLPTIEGFEAEAGVRIPDDYRDFLLRVANGGNSPCRLTPLSRWDGSYWVANPTPWMASQPCILSPKAVEHGADWLDHAKVTDWQPRWDRNEWDPMFGTIAIAEIGCGLFFSMVMVGPLRGRIFAWGDHALNPPQFWPESNFSEWFEGCLDTILSGNPVHFLDGRIR